MPAPVESNHRYIAGLDGIRAIAVLAVIAFHLNVGWAKGGLLGVGVFFTLSGYLITDLLLSHWKRHGNLGLGQFWMRRARRLLPALFLMLIVVSICVALFDAAQVHEVRRQVISAALYFANWSTIAVNQSYFARFAAPLPLDHLWSLSIEEQFYLVWPWLLLGMLHVFRRGTMVVVTLVAAAFSAWLMGHLYHPGFDPTRVYEGTDTRAFGLLLGAGLAMVWPTQMTRAALRRSVRSPTGLDIAGVVGLGGIFLLVWQTSSLSSFLYPTGIILLSVATVLVIAAVINPSSLLGEVLGCPPLRWVGVRSYGIYLWHWPIIVLWGGHETGVNWPRASLQISLTFLIASLSWRYVEDPIRRGALRRLRRRPRTQVAAARRRRKVLGLTTGLAAALLLVVVGLAGALPVISQGHTSPAKISKLPPSLAGARNASATTTNKAAQTLPPATKTSCHSVVYIGDSTSEGQVSTDYIPNPHKRLEAVLGKVGVRTVYPEISGARSTLETYEGIPNAATVAQEHISHGFNGCWIFALGTNDVDNAVTSPVNMPTRIRNMMKVVGHQPVLWIAVISLLSSGPYSEAGMQKWNRALLSDCKRYPNMRVYDWPDKAKRKWFIPDGIHYYSPGYVARNRDIAHGLVRAFPTGEPPNSSCLVQ